MKVVGAFQKELAAVFERRKKRNGAYSQRAYARDLGLSPSLLSEVLQGKHGLSLTKAKQVGVKLGYTDAALDRFCDRAVAAYGRKAKDRKDAEERILAQPQTPFLELDRFEVIATWTHYAILELTLLRKFKPNAAWVAKQLNVPVDEARACIERLLRVGLLKGTPEKFQAAETSTRGPDEIPSAAVREMHAQLLTKASEALESQDLAERDFQAAVVAIPRAKVSVAKRKIRQFITQLLEELSDSSTGDEKDSVYALGLQLYALTPNSEEGETRHVTN